MVEGLRLVLGTAAALSSNPNPIPILTPIPIPITIPNLEPSGLCHQLVDQLLDLVGVLAVVVDVCGVVVDVLGAAVDRVRVRVRARAGVSKVRARARVRVWVRVRVRVRVRARVRVRGSLTSVSSEASSNRQGVASFPPTSSARSSGDTVGKRRSWLGVGLGVGLGSGLGLGSGSGLGLGLGSGLRVRAGATIRVRVRVRAADLEARNDARFTIAPLDDLGDGASICTCTHAYACMHTYVCIHTHIHMYSTQATAILDLCIFSRATLQLHDPPRRRRRRPPIDASYATLSMLTMYVRPALQIHGVHPNPNRHSDSYPAHVH